MIRIVNIIARENKKTRNLGYDIFFLTFSFHKIILKYTMFFFKFVIELLILCTYRGKKKSNSFFQLQCWVEAGQVRTLFDNMYLLCIILFKNNCFLILCIFCSLISRNVNASKYSQD